MSGIISILSLCGKPHLFLGSNEKQSWQSQQAILADQRVRGAQVIYS
jgi:hypothetical protein